MWIALCAIAIATGIGLCMVAIMLTKNQTVRRRHLSLRPYHAWEDVA